VLRDPYVMEPGTDHANASDSTHIDDPGRADDADTSGPLSPRTAGPAERERDGDAPLAEREIDDS